MAETVSLSLAQVTNHPCMIVPVQPQFPTAPQGQGRKMQWQAIYYFPLGNLQQIGMALRSSAKGSELGSELPSWPLQVCQVSGNSDPGELCELLSGPSSGLCCPVTRRRPSDRACRHGHLHRVWRSAPRPLNFTSCLSMIMWVATISAMEWGRD